ncbi:MAG: hypothetical protein A1D16_19920 [Flavihumibacter sp. CACIAM 22H1]|nr:MAG: hypothetical protein A1D16_19920 [Flavihumibacter sp. CACIAM 22H1]
MFSNNGKNSVSYELKQLLVKTSNLLKLISIAGVALTVIFAFVQAGSDGTNLLLTLVLSLLFIAASVKNKNLENK